MSSNQTPEFSGWMTKQGLTTGDSRTEVLSKARRDAMSLEHVRRLYQRVTYKPGFFVEVYDSFDEIKARIFLETEDSRPGYSMTNEEIRATHRHGPLEAHDPRGEILNRGLRQIFRIQMSFGIPYELVPSMSDRSLLDGLFEQIMIMERHEATEFFKVGGVFHEDPHPPPVPIPQHFAKMEFEKDPAFMKMPEELYDCVFDRINQSLAEKVALKSFMTPDLLAKMDKDLLDYKDMP